MISHKKPISDKRSQVSDNLNKKKKNSVPKSLKFAKIKKEAFINSFS